MIQETPAKKKPLTSYLMFCQKEREANKDANLKVADLGKKWKEMTDEQKKPYNDSYKKAKEEYDKYMIEVEGKAPKSSEKKEKPSEMSVARVRAICGKGSKVKAMDQHIYKGIAHVVVTNLSHDQK